MKTLWHDQWNKLLSESGEQAEWKTPWIDNSFADGTPFLVGNPIFSAVCPSRRLGVRVIQHDPSEGHTGLSYWTDTFAAGDPEEVHELVMACVLTSETLRECLALMSQWVRGEEVTSPGRVSGR
jgi:hypothetical protein